MADREPAARNAGHGYERTDVSVAGVGLVALFAVFWLAIVPLILAWGYPQVMSDTDKRPRVTPPAPRLQVDPNADLAAFRSGEEQRLSSYGWVDRGKGIVHIPIDEAMAKLAREGIADWPKPEPPP